LKWLEKAATLVAALYPRRLGGSDFDIPTPIFILFFEN